MRDAGQSNIRAITLAFEEFAGSHEDEAPLAARVARHYGASHIVRRVGKKEFDDDLPAIFDAMDQPSIDGVNTWFVSKAAKEAGLKVALSGLGGDELLAGYPSFIDVPRWRRRFGPLAAVPGLGRMARRLASTFAPRLARSNPKALGLLDHASSWAGAYLLRRGLFLPHELTQVIDADVAREGLRRLQPLKRLSASLVPDPGSDVGRVAVLESTQYMRNQLLRDADWAGMAHGVEIRLPLVDTTLLETLSAVIGRIMPGAGKLALAAAPSHPLPDEIVARAKTGFGVPTSAWAGDASASSGLRSSGKSKGLTSRRWSQLVVKAAGQASDKWLPVSRA
jgi:asparagine synthase (glutamine-hydrolysing)